MIDLNEDDDDYLDTFKKEKRKKRHDSDEEYNIEEDEELYSDIDSEDDDISFTMNRTVKKKKPKPIKNINNNQTKKNKPIRISLKKSLGGKNHRLKFKKRININDDLNTPFKDKENSGTKPKIPSSTKLIKNIKKKRRKKYISE